MPLTTLEWFGTATFRVRHAGLDLFFDAYLDRLPGLDPVGLTTAEVEQGRLRLREPCPLRPSLRGRRHRAATPGPRSSPRPSRPGACASGACPTTQLLVVTGGETVQCGPTTRVRVLPALHSCLFAHSDADTSVACLGDLGVSAQDRAATVRSLFGAMDAAPAPAGPALIAMNESCSRHDGGQLAYLLMTRRRFGAGQRRARATGAASSTACAPTSPCSPSVAGPTSTASPSRAPRSSSCSSRCSGCAPGGSPSATTTRSSPACRAWTSGRRRPPSARRVRPATTSSWSTPCRFSSWADHGAPGTRRRPGRVRQPKAASDARSALRRHPIPHRHPDPDRHPRRARTSIPGCGAPARSGAGPIRSPVARPRDGR